MAFRRWLDGRLAFRRIEGERRRRFQEYEDLVDQDYDPFHIKCGKNVFLSDKKLIATQIGRSDGIVFSAKPIPLGGKFQVKLLEKGGDGHLVSAQSNLSHTLYV